VKSDDWQNFTPIFGAFLLRSSAHGIRIASRTNILRQNARSS